MCTGLSLELWGFRVFLFPARPSRCRARVRDGSRALSDLPAGGPRRGPCLFAEPHEPAADGAGSVGYHARVMPGPSSLESGIQDCASYRSVRVHPPHFCLADLSNRHVATVDTPTDLTEICLDRINSGRHICNFVSNHLVAD